MAIKTCNKPAVYRFTWPGKDERVVCDKCVNGIRVVAGAMGLRLQITPLSEEDRKIGLKCPQQVSTNGGART